MRIKDKNAEYSDTENDLEKIISSIVKNILVRGENKRKCAEYCRKIYLELNPRSEIESVLAGKIIYLGWKSVRLTKIESRLLSEKNKPVSDNDYEDWGESQKIHRVRTINRINPEASEIKTIHLQIIATEKAFAKALDQYRKEQN